MPASLSKKEMEYLQFASSTVLPFHLSYFSLHAQDQRSQAKDIENTGTDIVPQVEVFMQ